MEKKRVSFDHAVIKHLHMKDLKKEIKAELDNVHSTSAPAFATVYNWENEFKREIKRRISCDAPRSRRPIEATILARPCDDFKTMFGDVST